MPRLITAVDVERPHRLDMTPEGRHGAEPAVRHNQRRDPDMGNARSKPHIAEVTPTVRSRLARMQGMETVRARIAADLHDDVGSALSRLSILTEVVKRQIGAADPRSRMLLDDIADTARGILDAISDVVWSVDPRCDDLGSVVARVRRFAAGLLDSQGIQWELDAPAHPDRVPLDAQQRRHLFLMCKEAITNVVRHAACRSLSVSLIVANRRMVLDVHDDGRGLTVQDGFSNAQSAGHGLENLQGRAGQLGGSCVLRSTPGRGTHLYIEFPLRRRSTSPCSRVRPRSDPTSVNRNYDAQGASDDR